MECGRARIIFTGLWPATVQLKSWPMISIKSTAQRTLIAVRAALIPGPLAFGPPPLVFSHPLLFPAVFPHAFPLFSGIFYGPAKTKEASPCDLSQSSSSSSSSSGVWQQEGNLGLGSICLSTLLFDAQHFPTPPLIRYPMFSLSAALFIVIMNLCYPKSAAQLRCALMCVCVCVQSK